MDSTMVNQVGHIAVQLGVTAKEAFMWWIVAKLAIHVVWMLFASLVAWRLSLLLSKFGRGQQLLGIIAELGGDSSWCSSTSFNRAVLVLRENAAKLDRYGKGNH